MVPSTGSINTKPRPSAALRGSLLAGSTLCSTPGTCTPSAFDPESRFWLQVDSYTPSHRMGGLANDIRIATKIWVVWRGIWVVAQVLHTMIDRVRPDVLGPS